MLLNYIKMYFKKTGGGLISKQVPNKRVLVSGWTSSGSTFIYQVTKLLGLDVDKEHGFVSDKSYFLKLFTIRDPRDIITSNAKRVSKDTLEKYGRDEALKEALYRFLNNKFKEDYYKALRDRNTFIVKYELFMPNKKEDVLVSFIANQFGILLSEERLENIIENTSIEKNKMRSSAMNNFKTWDERTKIHGDHITSDGREGNWRSFFTDEFVLLFKKELGSLLIELGYARDSDWGV